MDNDKELEFWNSIQKSLQDISNAIDIRKKNLCIVESKSIERELITGNQKEVIQQVEQPLIDDMKKSSDILLNTEHSISNNNTTSQTMDLNVSETIKKDEVVKKEEISNLKPVSETSNLSDDPLSDLGVLEELDEEVENKDFKELKDEDNLILDDDDGIGFDDPFKDL